MSNILNLMLFAITMTISSFLGNVIAEFVYQRKHPSDNSKHDDACNACHDGED